MRTIKRIKYKYFFFVMTPYSLVKYVSAFGKNVEASIFTEVRNFVTTYQIIRCHNPEPQNLKRLQSIRYQTKNELKYLNTIEIRLSGYWSSGTPIIQIGLALRGNLSKILQNKLCLDITGYRIKYSIVLWLVELQIRRGRNI